MKVFLLLLSIFPTVFSLKYSTINKDLVQQLSSDVTAEQILLAQSQFSKLSKFLSTISNVSHPLWSMQCDNWKKSSKIGWNERCATNLQSFACDVAHSKTMPLWTSKLFDSFGRLNSGMLEGNLLWMGSYGECTDIVEDVQNQLDPDRFKGNYCKTKINLGEMINGTCTNIALSISLGICAPHTCRDDDLEMLINKYNPLSCPLTVQCEEATPLFENIWGIAVGMFVSLIVLIVIIGTTFDCFNKSANHNDLPTYWKIALCFSVYSNGSKILSIEHREGTMECIHGIRFISMCWVVLGHTYLFQLPVIDNLTWINSVLPYQFLFLIVNNASVSVDSFFVLSGFLLTYLFLKRGTPKSVYFWVMYYVHRYIRLTPVYMIVIAIGYAYYTDIGFGPFWPTTEQNTLINTCPQTWWMNALYINNFGDFTHSCIDWTWYLANDMQFYWISPPLLAMFYYTPMFGIISTLIISGLSIMSRILIMHENDYAPADIITANASRWIRPDFETVEYSKPYNRIGAYMMGMIGAYLLFRFKGKLKISKLSTVTIWLIILGLQWLVIFGPRNFALTSEWEDPWGSMYNGCYRTVWSITIAALIFMCASDHGGIINEFLSWSIFFPLSRLTYCCYLIHEFVLIWILYSDRMRPIHASHLATAQIYAAVLIFSYGLAFIVSLLFEAPVMNLEKLIFSSNDAKPERPTKSDNNLKTV